MTEVFTPIVNLGEKYINGCLLEYLTGTTLTVKSGQARSTGNVNDITVSSDILIDTAVLGAGGLDIGTMANNTTYAVYVVGSVATPGKSTAMISLSEVAPTLYGEWGVVRKVGHVLTNGSAAILPFTMVGDGLTREYMFDTLIAELASGAATTFTNIDLSSSIPLGARKVLLDVTITPATAANMIKLRTKGSAATNGNVRFSGDVAAVASTGQVSVHCDADAIIQYLVSNASDVAVVNVAGYTEVL